jgi:universal stress protein F
MYARIIAALDLDHLPQARALLARGLALLDNGGELRLVHALDTLPAFIAAELPADVAENARARAMVELRALIDPARPERMVPDLRHGAAASEILTAARETHADLIMLASHRPGLRDYFIGSTAAKVVRHAPCAVLVSRSTPTTKGETMYSSILIAAALFNDGATTREALTRARAMLSAGGKVTLVHVLEDVPGYVAASLPAAHLANRKVEVTAQLSAIAADYPDLSIDIVVDQGQPAGIILEAATDAAADLIMIASHKPGLSDYFIGSTAARVVRHAQTSVLVSR